jgi:hypothetical protein
MEERFEELTFFKEASVDGKPFFLFRNPANEYRIVEAQNYRSFNLLPGMTVRARVRKKGCAGQEISELIHTQYEEGKVYLFRIVRAGSVTFNNEAMHFLAVEDALGTEYKVKVENSASFSSGDVVKCRLEDQTNGRLRFVVEAS